MWLDFCGKLHPCICGECEKAKNYPKCIWPTFARKTQNRQLLKNEWFSTCCASFIRECLIKWFIDFFSLFCSSSSHIVYKLASSRPLFTRSERIFVFVSREILPSWIFNGDFLRAFSTPPRMERNELENYSKQLLCPRLNEIVKPSREFTFILKSCTILLSVSFSLSSDQSLKMWKLPEIYCMPTTKLQLHNLKSY